jgi:hypothetical protein
MVVNLRPRDTELATAGVGAIVIKTASHFAGSKIDVVRKSVPVPYGRAVETVVGSIIAYLLGGMAIKGQTGEMVKDAAVLGIVLGLDEALTASNVLSFADYDRYYDYAEVVPEERVQTMAEAVPEEMIQTV